MPKTKLTKDEALHEIAKIESDNAPSELLIDCYHDMLFNQMNEDLTDDQIYTLAEELDIEVYQWMF